MLAKTGGLAALTDRGVVTQCPLCDTDNPDLDNHGFCSNCGTLFRDKVRRRLAVVKMSVLLGVLLTAAGAALALTLELFWLGMSLFAVGLVPLAFGVLANWQLAGFLLDALERRTATDTQRSIRTTDRVAAGLVLFFLAAVAGSIPYYLYIEGPRHQLAKYETRFADKIRDYVALVPQDAEPAPDAKPYLAGKAVVIEKTATGAQVSEVHAALPPDVRAETPEEVGTVVLIEWKDVRGGHYGETAALAYRVHGDVRLINLQSKTLLAHEDFPGGDPPPQAPAGGGDGRGSKPIAKIVGYINGLDRSAPPPSPAVETPAAEPEKHATAAKADAAEAASPTKPKSAAQDKK